MTDQTDREGIGDLGQLIFTTAFTLSSLVLTGTLTSIQTWMTTEFVSWATFSLSYGGLVGYAGLLTLYFTNDSDLTDIGTNASRGLNIGLVFHTLLAWIPDVQNAILGSQTLQVLTLAGYLIIFAMINGDWYLAKKFEGGIGSLGGLR